MLAEGPTSVPHSALSGIPISHGHSLVGMRVWVNGTLLDDPDDRVLSVFDHGFTVGDGVFETVKVVDGTPFAMRRHLDRLERSARGLGLYGPDRALVGDAVAAVLDGESYPKGRLRITLTGGPGPAGTQRGTEGPTLVVVAGPLDPSPESTAVVMVPWRRNDQGATAGLKTTSYADNVIALAYARERGGSEAILANTAGLLCEGTGTNVFLGLGGRLVTPPLSAGCLAGVTRELVLELVDVVEEDVPVEALARSGEMFLTSSTRDVQPVRAVDGRLLPACPGPLTEGAGDAFRALVGRDLDP